MKAVRSLYVAAPFVDASRVRAVHEKLRAWGIVPASRWAELAEGPEQLDALSEARLAQIWAQNDHDVTTADGVLVMAREGHGGEMFAEARLAIVWGRPVWWLGRRTLSAYRPGVLRFDTLEEALSDIRRRR